MADPIIIEVTEVQKGPSNAGASSGGAGGTGGSMPPPVPPAPPPGGKPKKDSQTKELEQLIGSAGIGGKAASGLAAAAGPAGVALVIKEAIEEVQRKILAGIRAVGQAGGQAAALDTSVLSDGFNTLTEQVPLVGKYLAEMQRGLLAVVRGLDTTAEKLRFFSGPLAVASAQRDVGSILGDLRRAQRIGPELAAFVSARGKLEEQGKDLLAELIKPIIPLLTAVLERLLPYLETATAYAPLVAPALSGVGSIAKIAVDPKTGFASLVASIYEGKRTLKDIEENTKKPKDPVLNDFNVPGEIPLIARDIELIDMALRRARPQLNRPNFPALNP